MNLEQSKLTVNGTFNSNGGLLWEKQYAAKAASVLTTKFSTSRCYLRLFWACIVYFFICASKTLQKSWRSG